MVDAKPSMRGLVLSSLALVLPLALIGGLRQMPDTALYAAIQSEDSNVARTTQPDARPAGGTDESSSALQGRVEAFCGDCHKMPNPSSFDQDRWHFEVKRGYEFYAKSGRQDLSPPSLNETLNYFRERAPRRVSYAVSEEANGSAPVSFTTERFSNPSGATVLPEIAHLQWVQLDAETPVLLATDLRYGHVIAFDLQKSNRQPPRLLAQLRNPGRVLVCDIDSDGQQELLVGDLASYQPADHQRSRIVMLDPNPSRKDGQYDEVELLTDLGRVADLQAADFDGDSKLDLAIAEFGWRDVGRTMIARNLSRPGAPQFDLLPIDDRPGTLNVRINDFDGDGKLELATLLSQEYESVELFRRHPIDFVRRSLWTGPDLTYGCTSMEIIDLNQDGRTDILFTNGDTFDNNYVSPGHGVQWLENKGNLQFDYHRLTEMPGAYSAQAADFDLDGRMDIIAVARLPSNRSPEYLPRIASIVYLRQVEDGQFERHTLEWELPFYPSLAVGDFDSNGSPDFAVAPGLYVADLLRKQNRTNFLDVWWNHTSEQSENQ